MSRLQKNITVFLLLLFSTGVIAQAPDSLKPKKIRSPFADVQELTSSDYLSAIERANNLMNNVSNDGQFRRKTLSIFKEIGETNASTAEIIANINGAHNTNIRNQRMYEKVLVELQKDLIKYQDALNEETEKIIALKKHLRTNMKDTVFKKLVRDSVLRMEFRPQLFPLRTKFFATDSVLKSNLNILNTYKTSITEKKMIISEALVIVSARLDRSGVSIFGNEFPNLWDTPIKIKNQSISSFIAQKFFVEITAFRYYFYHSLRYTIILILVAGLLFWWIRYNIKYLSETGNLKTLDTFYFKYLNRGILLPVLVIVLNVAIAFNLYAPALYIEFLHLLLLIILSVLFFGLWHTKAYRRWILLVAIFTAFCFIDLFLKATMLQRCLFIALNVVAIRFGLGHLKYIKKEMYAKGFFRWANYIFLALNILAIISNLFGRVSLAHTLSLTAVIALTQIIALSVLLKILLESITLQVYTIRLRRGIVALFDIDSLNKNTRKPFLFTVLYLWLVVVASNLNLSEDLARGFDFIFNRKNYIGSFSFTLGSILLFVFIIWIAHLLQKFVAFFFGEVEIDNEATINKRQHSKLLITRLMLLVAGYLLAISASGMPLDKITIILGALGVGVGLGLQTVVNNFVSGVILIFERPIQIGDVIESGNESGRVKEIGLRTTKIDTANGAEVIIPNGNILSQNIVNWTYSNNYKLTEISFTITGEITRAAITELIRNALISIDEAIPDMEPEVFFDSVSENKSRVKVKFWCNIYRTDEAVSEARVVLYDSFKDKGILMEENAI